MTVLFAVLMAAASACGDNGSNNDTVLTGFSGVLVFGIIAWVIYRYISKKGNR